MSLEGIDVATKLIGCKLSRKPRAIHISPSKKVSMQKSYPLTLFVRPWLTSVFSHYLSRGDYEFGMAIPHLGSLALKSRTMSTLSGQRINYKGLKINLQI